MDINTWARITYQFKVVSQNTIYPGTVINLDKGEVRVYDQIYPVNLNQALVLNSYEDGSYPYAGYLEYTDTADACDKAMAMDIAFFIKFGILPAVISKDLPVIYRQAGVSWVVLKYPEFDYSIEYIFNLLMFQRRLALKENESIKNYQDKIHYLLQASIALRDVLIYPKMLQMCIASLYELHVQLLKIGRSLSLVVTESWFMSDLDTDELKQGFDAALRDNARIIRNSVAHIGYFDSDKLNSRENYWIANLLIADIRIGMGKIIARLDQLYN